MKKLIFTIIGLSAIILSGCGQNTTDTNSVKNGNSPESVQNSGADMENTGDESSITGEENPTPQDDNEKENVNPTDLYGD